MRPAAKEVYSTFSWSDEAPEKDATLAQVMAKFDEYCNPRSNVTFERFQFNSRTPNSAESFEHYVTELRKLQAQCDFGNVTPDQLLRDRIIFGISDSKVRE